MKLRKFSASCLFTFQINWNKWPQCWELKNLKHRIGKVATIHPEQSGSIKCFGTDYYFIISSHELNFIKRKPKQGSQKQCNNELTIILLGMNCILFYFFCLFLPLTDRSAACWNRACLSRVFTIKISCRKCRLIHEHCND